MAAALLTPFLSRHNIWYANIDWGNDLVHVSKKAISWWANTDMLSVGTIGRIFREAGIEMECNLSWKYLWIFE